MAHDATEIALIHAFEGPGLPRAQFPDLDETTLSDYVARLSMVGYFETLPRSIRRLPRADRELLLDTIVRAMGRGFWAGAAYVVARDNEQ